MTETRLFFGSDIPGGGQVGAADWTRFADEVLTPAFPDGFTTFEAHGQWRSPDGHVTREASRVVQALGPVTPAQVQTVASAYRHAFRQEAVGVVTGEVCASFSE